MIMTGIRHTHYQHIVTLFPSPLIIHSINHPCILHLIFFPLIFFFLYTLSNHPSTHPPIYPFTHPFLDAAVDEREREEGRVAVAKSAVSNFPGHILQVQDKLETYEAIVNTITHIIEVGNTPTPTPSSVDMREKCFPLLPFHILIFLHSYSSYTSHIHHTHRSDQCHHNLL